jgi:hypothetical protein
LAKVKDQQVRDDLGLKGRDMLGGSMMVNRQRELTRKHEVALGL